MCPTFKLHVNLPVQVLQVSTEFVAVTSFKLLLRTQWTRLTSCWGVKKINKEQQQFSKDKHDILNVWSTLVNSSFLFKSSIEDHYLNVSPAVSSNCKYPRDKSRKKKVNLPPLRSTSISRPSSLLWMEMCLSVSRKGLNYISDNIFCVRSLTWPSQYITNSRYYFTSSCGGGFSIIICSGFGLNRLFCSLVTSWWCISTSTTSRGRTIRPKV